MKAKRESINDTCVHISKVAITYCLRLNCLDFLFDEWYVHVQNTCLAPAFFATLTPYILDGTITVLTPVVMRDFVENCARSGRGEELENVLFLLRVSDMDIHQVIRALY